MSFLSEQGALALGSRFKALSDRLYDAVDEVYRAQGSAVQARWFPVLRMLQQRGPQSVTELARDIGQTHPAVSQLANKLAAVGLIELRGDEGDRRRRVLALTDGGRTELAALERTWRTIADEVAALDGAQELLAALPRFEQAVLEAPLAPRLLARCRAAAQQTVVVRPYAPELREHFYRLNAEWLQRYFYIEQIDHDVLSDPETHILDGGGAILFAQLDDDVIGTCALKQESPGVFELTKMAVTERRQGLGAGRLLLAAAIEEFRRRGGRQLFLESHSKLQPALHLYESLGFEMQPGRRPDSQYQRSDVYMIWSEMRDQGTGKR